MTKLLDADWLRGVQLFHQLYSSTINDFETNKQNCGKVFQRAELLQMFTGF